MKIEDSLPGRVTYITDVEQKKGTASPEGILVADTGNAGVIEAEEVDSAQCDDKIIDSMSMLSISDIHCPAHQSHYITVSESGIVSAVGGDVNITANGRTFVVHDGESIDVNLGSESGKPLTVNWTTCSGHDGDCDVTRVKTKKRKGWGAERNHDEASKHRGHHAKRNNDKVRTHRN